MSRSRRKNPIVGHTTAESEKTDKRLANRRYRRRARQVLGGSDPAGDVIMPHVNEVSNVWQFDKDGKQYLDSPEPKDMRK